MSLLQLGISIALTIVFVIGSWRLVCAFGEAGRGNGFGAAMNFCIGLGLKFPAVVYILKIMKSPSRADHYGAIAGVCLVYFLTVVGMAIHGFRQNNTNQ